MKIAYLVSDYSAPSHTFVRREVAALRSRKIDVRAFSIQREPADGDAESLLEKPIRSYLTALVWALATRPRRLYSTWKLALDHRVGGFRALLWSQFHFIEALLLAKRMCEEDVDHLHNHFANSGATVGMLAAHCLGTPWSLTLHGISETDYPAGALLAAKIRRASFVACASYFMRAQAMRVIGPEHWSKMHIVRCGIDLTTLPKRAHANANRQPGVPRLISVGRLSPEKGYSGLFTALSGLVAEGHDFSLTIVGDGPSAAAIRAEVTAWRLDSRIRFVGALSERSTLARMAEADIFILPSLMEGLPVVLIEALAMEMPVIASRVAGIPELLEDDKSGHLFTPSNWGELREVLGALMADRYSWGRLGAAGRLRVLEEFQADTAAARLVKLFAASR